MGDVADGSPDAIPGGKGDGLVEILTNTIPPPGATVPPCVINRRFPATDPATHTAQPMRSISVAPGFRTGDGRNFKPGEILGGMAVVRHLVKPAVEARPILLDERGRRRAVALLGGDDPSLLLRG